MKKPLLSFYGDDFTGATDAMDALSRQGVRTVLFLETPDPEQIEEEFNAMDAIGVAGMSRSLRAEQLDEELSPAFETLKEIGAPITHYKICSTFDSSPHVGSIGRAIEIGQRVFKSSFVPVSVGVPQLQRFVAFSNLFAQDNGSIYRIDNHPTMSDHPVTPMQHGDLRTHLRKQTDCNISRMDVTQLQGDQSSVDEAFQSVRDSKTEILLFDTVTESDMKSVGRLMWESSQQESGSLFIVGSSGVEYALANHWQQINTHDTNTVYQPPDAVDRLLVMSGSASPMTRSQIEWAVDNGFTGIRINTKALIDPVSAEQERREVRQKALGALDTGNSVVLYTALGPDDTSISEAKRHYEQIASKSESLGDSLGRHQGQIVKGILDEVNLERICIAGGDTCGHVMSALDIYTLESKAPIAPGAPLCRIQSYSPEFKDVGVALKGGQLGQIDYFGRVRDGKESTN